MSYGLTADVGVKLGPVMLETAFKHFLAQRNGEVKAKDEILYHEAFNIVKTFMQTSTKHAVEELQQFSNQRIPVPPWVHAPRVLIPMTTCDEAAKILINVLGGPEVCKQLVGGTKWWQVRGVEGVHGQWIAARKDWQEAKRKRKEYESKHKSKPPEEADIVHEYQPEMDQMRCMLFAHGGGYFFGSIDQERYCMQRYARKMKGRVFGYRLAPQYPFPCAIQDVLAAYLYLIRPPPGAKHLPVPPSMIILGGSSAGGGLMIALLQTIRDAGLPLPAGAVLISPWCDLTHSFPSIHENTATDVIPTTGLSFLKPSVLWPPPTEEESHAVVREKLKTRIKRLMSRDTDTSSKYLSADHPVAGPGGKSMSFHHIRHARSEGDLGVPRDAKTKVAGDIAGDKIEVVIGGIHTEINSQIHLYCPNRLIKHPLVSPVVSYLGGLPPLFFIASDKEVLRDEIIYAAHKAARPDKYPISDEVKMLYPVLQDIEGRGGPTKVHLQIYDDTCHVLPLFSFCAPAKFRYRAIASFCRHVVPDRQPRMSMASSPPSSPSHENMALTDGLIVRTPEQVDSLRINASTPATSAAASSSTGVAIATKATDRPGAKRGLTATASTLKRRLSLTVPPSLVRRSKSAMETSKVRFSTSAVPIREDSGDVAGKRFGHDDSVKGPGCAGDPVVYALRDGKDPFAVQNPICDPVSTVGVLRKLGEEHEVQALSMPPEHIGVISEASAQRFIDAKAAFDKRYSGTAKGVQRSRSKYLSKAASKKEKTVLQQLAQAPFQTFILPVGSMSPWYFDANEDPPSGSLVARRDAAEARRLGMIADQSLSQEETRMSGNSLWSAVANFLSTSPETDKHMAKAETDGAETSTTSVAAQSSSEAVLGFDPSMPVADGTRESRAGSSIRTLKSILSFRKATTATAS
ncbi:alpha/beta-hydrolase [Auriculariales sp. MPI-PUGE-AT-0066]|nr:alpha/beta-hydrolase [Auriculariales sp. MPI-PUGE-AT-0066]